MAVTLVVILSVILVMIVGMLSEHLKQATWRKPFGCLRVTRTSPSSLFPALPGSASTMLYLAQVCSFATGSTLLGSVRFATLNSTGSGLHCGSLVHWFIWAPIVP